MARTKRVISPEVAEAPPETWSNCLVADGIAYIAGMTARDAAMKPMGGDAYDQAKVVFTKIRHLVEAAGGTMSDIVKLTIFVTDMKQRDKVWAARREFFTGDFPACSLVQVAALSDPALRVEIEAVAHVGTGTR